MGPSIMAVVRCDKRWGVSVDGEVLALARTKAAAARLARDAVEILRASGADARVADQPRSFREDEA